MKEVLSIRPLALAMAAVSGSLAPTVFAQAENPQSYGIEEVTVTARKREESLQDIPVAVSAMGADDMREKGVQSIEDMAGRVPGFQINMFSNSEPDIFMRGIGTDIESAGAAGAIGVFVDEVYISRGAGVTADLFDLQRVEILRGPQGTLYGKNVVGGAISYVTARPQQEFSALAETTLGTYGQTELRGYVTGGLSDNLAARVSVSGRKRDGYAENTYTGNDIETLDNSSIRAQLSWDLSDSVNALLSLDQYRSESTARWRHMSIVSEWNAPFQNDDPRKGPNNEDGVEKGDGKGASLRVEWQGDNLTLTSLTAYRENDSYFKENSAGTFYDFSKSEFENPDDYYVQTKHEVNDQFSQELRLSGSSDKLNWVAGLYYLQESIERNELADFVFYFPEWYWVMEGEDGNRSASDNVSTAAFSQVTYDFNDQWSLTGGLRWSQDEKDFSASHWGIPLNGEPFQDPWQNPGNVETNAGSAEDSFGAVTKMATVNYRPAEDVLLYGTYSEGYKSGGWNGENALSPADVAIGFDEEFADNHELGIKSRWLDNRLQLNGALFVALYDDQQIQQLVREGNAPPSYQIANADARARGLELEFVYMPLEALTLSGSYGYLDSEFTSNLDIDGENLKGNKTARSPEHSYNLSAVYAWDLANIGELNARLDYRWQDEFFFDNDNNPLTHVDAQYTLDGSIALFSADGRWDAKLWGKNLTDELNVASVSEIFGTVFAGYQAPRTVGVTGAWHF
ncbi:TonB-dependent receptor [uncultured Microbulbifer sp.]|uniref:TonB-dependent receptor n=1 Tax=uncultured Microbulbifer sp. TaxID=348147 RepID=UPI002612E263|nr:TonB-dependent receptor [uncultured Microbulbifer sp.]